MRSRRQVVGTLGTSVTLLLMAFACGDDKKAGCVSGSERCACYPNDTCDAELVCLSHLCVSTSEGGRPGTNGEGGVGATSTPGDAGSTGEGGAPASAGSPGSGGSAGSAGSPESAGSAGMEAGGSAGADSTSGGTATTGGASTTTGGKSATTGGASTTTGGTNASGGDSGSGGSTGVPEGSLLSNGDFSLGSADWNPMLQAGTGVSTFSNGHACLQGDPTLVFTLGWPLVTAKAFVMEPGVPYTLSFRAMAGAPFTLTAKIGHAVTPYTQVYAAVPTLTTAWASYSYNVVAASGDSAAGFVFSGTLLSGNSVCFDDVALVEN